MSINTNFLNYLLNNICSFMLSMTVCSYTLSYLYQQKQFSYSSEV